MNLVTMTFDADEWQVVPKKANIDMSIAGCEAGYNHNDADSDSDRVSVMYQAMLHLAPQPPAVSAEPVALNIIRDWPEGFQDRLQHVWLDVVGFTPNVKLYDLQCVLAEFGFTMLVFEGKSIPSADAKDAALSIARKALVEVFTHSTIDAEVNWARNVLKEIDAAMQKGGA